MGSVLMSLRTRERLLSFRLKVRYPWMQSDFCCCGQNAKDCKFCERQSVFALNGVSSSEETKCYAVPHRADCSCTIYGPSRNLWQDMDYPDCDIIVNHTFLPKGENNG